MPQPVIPDIDINNYFMMNMANMNVQEQAPVPPPLPPKPKNIVQPSDHRKETTNEGISDKGIPMKEITVKSFQNTNYQKR